jgi:hypothetical protein
MKKADRKARRTLALLALALGAALALVMGAMACNLVLDTGSYAACFAAEDAGWFDAGCLACVQENCCDKAALCAADPTCAAQQSCAAQGYPALSCVPDGVYVSATSTRVADSPLSVCAQTLCAATCGTPPSPWGCLGNAPPNPPDAGDDAGDVTVTLVPTIYNSAGCLTDSDSPAAIARVLLCGGIGCLSGYTGPDTAGPLAVKVHAPFQGYLDVMPSQGSPDPPLHSLVYLAWPIVADTTIELRFLTQGRLAAFAGILGAAAPDAGAGTLVVLVRDCQGRPASGVTITPDPYQMPSPLAGATGYTFSDCFPSMVGTELLQAPTTTLDGVAGWVGAFPGYDPDAPLAAKFTATIDGGLPFAVIQPSVQAATVTYVWLAPAPLQ